MAKLIVIMYHYVRDFKQTRYSRIKGLDVRLFKQQLSFLKKHFPIITLEQAEYALQTRTLKQNSVLLTFDDGYTDHYHFVLPELRRAKVQGAFFIPAKPFTEHQVLNVNKIHYILACAKEQDLLRDIFNKIRTYENLSPEKLFTHYAKASRFDIPSVVFIKKMLQTVLPDPLRTQLADELFAKYVNIPQAQLAQQLYLSRSQIFALKQEGMTIGIHGYEHQRLNVFTKTELDQDISLALKQMAEFIDLHHWAIAYPYGDYNLQTLNYLRTKGAALGFTTHVRAADITKEDPLLIPRFDCNDFPPIAATLPEGLL